MNRRKISQKGFSLIEMLFYLLFIIFIIGGTLGIAGNLLKNNEHLKTGISTEEEGNFILKKISWALNDTDWGYVTMLPARNSSGPSLQVYKNDFSANPVVIDSDNGRVRIKRGTGPFKQFSNDRFDIQDLNFERTWDGADPGSDSIKVSFRINGREFQLTRKIR